MDTKEKLILAGMDVLEKYGTYGFSMRRTAAACGLSCAAPYKHFSGKDELVREIFRYINEKWLVFQLQAVERGGSDPRRRLVEVSMEYVRFLCDNPQFFGLLLQPDDKYARGRLSDVTRTIIDEYCTQVGMSEVDRKRKTFIVRSIIYGGVIMLQNGELPKTEKGLATVRSSIEREFDLD